MSILYIEDNEHQALVVSSLLRVHGYHVEYYPLGKPGLEGFHKKLSEWEAVIIDLDLPDISGKDLIKEMASRRPNLPILVHSGAKGLELQFKLYSSGATALLAKPCAAQDLLNVLKELMEAPPKPQEPRLAEVWFAEAKDPTPST